jgi:hypothetical protein
MLRRQFFGETGFIFSGLHGTRRIGSRMHTPYAEQRPRGKIENDIRRGITKRSLCILTRQRRASDPGQWLAIGLWLEFKDISHST